MKPVATLLALLLLAGPVAPRAFGQGCAMCLTSATALGPGAMGAMNLGILVLLVPPFLMIVAILAFTFLRRSG
jgi:hypothetical protein